MRFDLRPYVEGHRRRMESERHRLERRRDRIGRAVRKVAPELARKFRLRRIWFHGSWVWGKPHEGSDIDFAVEGLRRGRWLTAWLEAERLLAREIPRLGDEETDLRRFEDLPAYARARILEEGIALHDDGRPRARA